LIRVLLVVHPRFYRESLLEVLTVDDRVTVRGAAAKWEEAVARYADSDPDIIICDLDTPDALRGVRSLWRSFPRARIVALGVPDTEGRVLPLAEAGISGYVPGDSSLNELTETIITVARGELRCSPRVAAALMRRLAALTNEHRCRELEARLTSREQDVLALLDEGLSNKEIAARLFIEVPTVKNHVHNIFEKLRVSTRGQVVALLHQR
jgi:two-component system nitrate/nitrite response regulator NarL